MIADLEHAASTSYSPLPESDHHPPPATHRRRPITLLSSIFLSMLLLSSFIALIVNQHGQLKESGNVAGEEPHLSPKSTLATEFLKPVSRGVANGVSEKSNIQLSFSGENDIYPWTNAMLTWQRTGFHFQPPKNWMNDPDGRVEKWTSQPILYPGDKAVVAKLSELTPDELRAARKRIESNLSDAGLSPVIRGIAAYNPLELNDPAHPELVQPLRQVSAEQGIPPPAPQNLSPTMAGRSQYDLGNPFAEEEGEEVEVPLTKQKRKSTRATSSQPQKSKKPRREETRGATSSQAGTGSELSKSSGKGKATPAVKALMKALEEHTLDVLSDQHLEGIMSLSDEELPKRTATLSAMIALVGMRASIKLNEVQKNDENVRALRAEKEKLADAFEITRARLDSLDTAHTELKAHFNAAELAKFSAQADLERMKSALAQKEADLERITKEKNDIQVELEASRGVADNVVVNLCGRLVAKYPDLDLSFHPGLAAGAEEARARLKTIQEAKAKKKELAEQATSSRALVDEPSSEELTIIEDDDEVDTERLEDMDLQTEVPEVEEQVVNEPGPEA